MCLAAIAVACSERFPWVLASNRDEFFDRPALPLAWWQPAAGATPILSGRDLTAGGTWLGLTQAGALALVTNVREPGRFDPAATTRGDLVLQWLQGSVESAGGPASDDEARIEGLARPPRNGFNLYAADLVAGSGGAERSSLWVSNRSPRHRNLGPGVVGLSNAALDTPWPKVQMLKQRLVDALRREPDASALASAAFQALADRAPAADEDLPTTGVPVPRERQLSSACIRIEDAVTGRVYGTRCSTLVIVERVRGSLQVLVVERSFGPDGIAEGDVAIDWRLSDTAA
jgi:uncharacterized protein with NRDE domain